MSRITPYCLALLACLLSPLPVRAATMTPTSASGFGGDNWVGGVDDWSTSTLNPIPYGSAPFGSFFTTILSNAGFDGSDWTFQPASGTFLTADVTIDDYYAWVVDSPDVYGPVGVYNVDKKGAVGGAVFALTYTQKNPSDPDPSTIHFLQIYSERLNGNPTTYGVDNNGSTTTPFYDKIPGASVERSGNTAWFSDEPFLCENIAACSVEGPEDTSGSYSFGVYLVSDDTSSGSNVVKVYGGYQWGYTYTNVDKSPEPGGLLLGGLGIFGIALVSGLRRLR